MVIRLDIEIWEIGEGGTKWGVGKGGGWARVGGWGRGMRAAGFCGPCVCLGVFLLL
jgi:hypothetical protein